MRDWIAALAVHSTRMDGDSMRFCKSSGCNLYRSLPRMLLVVAGMSIAGMTQPANAQVTVVRVEEDWELVIATPDEDGDSPQVTTAMSPAGDDEADYCSFELNHQSQPSYFPGGLHLHAWDGEYLLGSVHEQNGASLYRVHERISWTQAMSLSDGQLTYEVKQGSSETWSAFGGESLRLVVNSTLPNLNEYDPSESLRDTGVGYGANRVVSLTLVRVRLVTSTEETFEVDINQDVLQDSE
jgi:hypothetical protein